MSTSAGDNAFLHELELDVTTELTLAETSQQKEAVDAPLDEWLPDTEAQRYEVRLRTLLGAVEALEDDASPGTGGA